MKEEKQFINKFKEEMGFKDCNEVDNNYFSDKEFIGRGKEKIISDCINYSNEKYECSIVIDSESKKIIKSNCEKSIENDY